MENSFDNGDVDALNEFLDKKLKLPLKHIKAATSKHRMMAMGFVELLGYWIDEVPEEKLGLITEIMIDALMDLMVDDIIEKTDMRGGQPATYKVYGVINTLVSSDYALLEILDKFLELEEPKAVHAYLNALTASLKGTAVEMYWRSNGICPTEEEYCQMVMEKVANMFLMPAILMQLFSSTKLDITKLVTTMALYMQINVDLHNLTNPECFKQKGYCEDLTEGKFSFPTVRAINSHPEEGKEIIDILRQQTTDVKLKERCCHLLEKCGSFEYTKKKTEELKKIIYEESEKFGGNPFLEFFMEKAANPYQ